MIEIRNSEQLQRWLLESGHLAPLWDRPRFLFDPEEFERELAGVRVQYPQFTAEEAEARAALRLMGKEEGRGRALVAGHRRQWTRRERLFLLALVALAAAIALLFAAANVPCAHAQQFAPGSSREGFRSARLGGLDPLRGFGLDQGGQPGGIIIQLANSGTVLSTTPAGLLQFNCSSGMACSWTAGSGSNPPTFTLTSTGGGGGSGCIPPGTTANALLFDAGSSACSDVSKFTWTAATNTLAGAGGGTLDLSALSLVKQRAAAGLTTSVNGDCGYDTTASRWHCWQNGADRLNIMATNAGNSGQPCLSNADGSCTFADPIVSGPDARGAAQSKNPVAVGGIDYTTNCSSGPCVQEAKVDSSGNVYVNVANTVPVSGTFWQATQPVSWSGQSVGLTGSWPYSGALGTVGVTSLPAIPTGSNNIGAVDVFGHAGAVFDAANNSAIPANSIAEGCEYLSSLPSITSGSIYIAQCDSSGRQLINVAVLPSIPAGSNTIGAVTQASGPWTANVTQFGSSNVVTGTGASGSGIPRVTVSNDSVVGISGENSSAALTTYLNCDNTAVYDNTTNGATQLVALTSGKTIYVCGFQFSTSQTGAVSVDLVYGTGTNCGTGTTKMTPAYPLQAASSTGPIGLVVMTPGFTGLKTASGNALCINTNAAVSMQAIVWYAGPF